MDENKLYETLGEIKTEIKNLNTNYTELKTFIKENEEEHKSILSKLDLYALQKDLNALGNRIRILEEKPDKQKAKIIDEAGKYILIFLGSGLFFYIISNINNIISFFSRMAIK